MDRAASRFKPRPKVGNKHVGLTRPTRVTAQRALTK